MDYSVLVVEVPKRPRDNTDKSVAPVNSGLRGAVSRFWSKFMKRSKMFDPLKLGLMEECSEKDSDTDSCVRDDR